METFKLVAKTLHGLEEVLAQELTDLGAQDVEQGVRVVTFTGDLEMMYRANFCLRTALRVLKPISEFEAGNAEEVYQAVSRIEWADYMDINTSFAVDSTVYSDDFRHSMFVAYKVKDAIVDYFRERTGKRPNISVANPDIRLNIHISGNACTLSLDSSGESLHKRGYREASVKSPINEVLAAGILLLAGWKGDTDLIDPMCGSGTIVVEAALIARNIWPGVFHTAKYAFEKWPDFNPDLLQTIYNDDSHERPFAHRIYARDIDYEALAAARANVRSAGVADCVEVSEQDFHHFTQPAEPALLVTNPPYGERISSPDLAGLYRTIGEKLKHQFVGGEAWIISHREEAFSLIGLKPSLIIPLFNGSLECELRKYQIFSGKMSTFRRDGGAIKSDDDRRRNEERRPLPRKPFADRRESDEPSDDDIPEYLRLRHRTFLANHREERPFRERRGDRPTRPFRDSDGQIGDRPFRGKRDRFGDRPPRKSHARSPWAKDKERKEKQ